ncbi:MAG: hypothetical protein ACT6FG_00010 [Methanosarcinaceae archaeon]
MIEKCDDPGCPGFGRQLVDRGFGFLVCPTTKPALIYKPIKPED